MDVTGLIIRFPPWLRGLAHGSGLDDAALWIAGILAAGLFFYFFLKDSGEGDIDDPQDGEHSGNDEPSD